MQNGNGILIIDKPEGWTSHDAVAKIRGLLKQRCDAPGKLKIGHGGTLDPMATGVLPIFIGRATRAAMFCENAEKEYIAGIRFGIVTDTQDITGKVLTSSSLSVIDGTDISGRKGTVVSKGELEAVLSRFVGKQEQIPPMYSAVKKGGKKLYELARRGIEVERSARDIEIMSLEIVPEPAHNGTEDLYTDGIELKSDIFIKVRCSKGTYVRTLCHDIGTALGCGAAMSYLRRTRAGVYSIEQAYPLSGVIEGFSTEMLLPVDSIFAQYPALNLSRVDSLKAKNGILSIPAEIQDGTYRVYSNDGEFLLLCRMINKKSIILKTFFEV